MADPEAWQTQRMLCMMRLSHSWQCVTQWPGVTSPAPMAVLSCPLCAPLQAQAAEDKQRYEAEVAAGGGAAAVAAAKPRAKRTKSAYQLFCDERLPLLRADNPQVGCCTGVVRAEK